MIDDVAILATLDEYADAYCTKDVDRLMEIFDPGPDTTVRGTGNDELCTGHHQIRELFNRNFTEATANRFDRHWTAVTVRQNTAVVATTLTIHLDIDDKLVEVPVRWTVALHKDGDKWLWLHRHASSAATFQDDGTAYPTGIDG